MVGAKEILPATVSGVLIALVFIALGLLVNFLEGLFSISVPIWTIIATVIILPLVGVKAKMLTMNKLLGLGLSVAIIGIIAMFVPAAQFLFDPFTTGVTNIVGLIAVLLHLSAAMVLADKLRAAF